MIWPTFKKPPQQQNLVFLKEKQVILRPAIENDYLEWRNMREKNQMVLRPFEPAWPKDSLTKDFFMRRLDRFNKDWRFDKTYGFLIFEQHTNALIGGMNINNVTRGAAQFASLGYWLDVDVQGRGYMTMAGMATLKFCFEDLKLYRVNAATLPHNIKSMAMLTRLGFKEEGFASKYIQINGSRQDHVLFGLNAQDFKESRAP